MKQENYRIDFTAAPTSEEEHLLIEGLNKEAQNAKGFEGVSTFGFFIRDEKDEAVGGLTGFTFYGCLYIDLFWLEASLRHQGLGTQLIQKAEKLGQERGCTFSTVNTMDWEALPFYQKCGYSIEFVREGYDKNSKLYMLRKSL